MLSALQEVLSLMDESQNVLQQPASTNAMSQSAFGAELQKAIAGTTWCSLKAATNAKDEHTEVQWAFPSFHNSIPSEGLVRRVERAFRCRASVHSTGDAERQHEFASEKR